MADQRDRWSLIEELFHEAGARVEGDRETFLRAHAGGDESIVAEVVALLVADSRSHVLLDAPAPGDLPAGMRLGPYALERVIGSGGMATVYLARRADHQFDKQVAIKLVNQGFAASLAGGRFETERHVLARLEHANIARLLDAGFNEYGQPYLVMEWIDGVTLDAWLARETPSLDRTLELWQQLAGAVAYAHRNLIVHRDIKPSNVLVDRDGVAKLVDFGIAKLVQEGVDAALTQTTHFTPRYASPEQLSGQPVTTAADVFGLGLLLCEMAAGVHPFARPGASTHEQAQAILTGNPVLPSTMPADLAAIIRMALRKEPERRYASVEAFAEDVRRYRRLLPVVAQPESVVYTGRRFLARHRLGVIAATVAIAAALATAAVFVRQARITAVERDRANLEARKTEQVNRFLQSMLSAADPSRDGREVKVVDVLDRAGDRLTRELVGQPELEAELRATLASTYQGLGVFDPAVSHARRALELREQIFGVDSAAAAGSRVDLGDALLTRGDYREAEPVLRQALATFERVGLDESVGAATGRRYLAEVLNEIGAFDEAERVQGQAIAQYRRLLPADDDRVAGALNDLGVLLGNRQQYAKAEPLHREALAIMRRVHGPSHLDVAQTLNNLAGVLDYQKRYDEAEPLYREALDIQIRILGEDHSRVVVTRSSLANMFWMKGDYAQAEPFARAALTSAERTLPEGHPLTAYAHIVLGQTLTDAGRPAEGEPSLRAALTMRRKLLPPNHWLIANTENVLGGCLVAQRRYAEAERLLVPSYRALLADRGADNDKTHDARRRLAALYRGSGRPKEAAEFETQ